jgi:hypothetical protein
MGTTWSAADEEETIHRSYGGLDKGECIQAFAADTSVVIVKPKAIEIWSQQSGDRRSTTPVQGNAINTCSSSFSSFGGGVFAVGSSDGTVHVYSPREILNVVRVFSFQDEPREAKADSSVSDMEPEGVELSTFGKGKNQASTPTIPVALSCACIFSDEFVALGSESGAAKLHSLTTAACLFECTLQSLASGEENQKAFPVGDPNFGIVAMALLPAQGTIPWRLACASRGGVVALFPMHSAPGGADAAAAPATVRSPVARPAPLLAIHTQPDLLLLVHVQAPPPPLATAALNNPGLLLAIHAGDNAMWAIQPESGDASILDFSAELAGLTGRLGDGFHTVAAGYREPVLAIGGPSGHVVMRKLTLTPSTQARAQPEGNTIALQARVLRVASPMGTGGAVSGYSQPTAATTAAVTVAVSSLTFSGAADRLVVGLGNGIAKIIDRAAGLHAPPVAAAAPPLEAREKVQQVPETQKTQKAQARSAVASHPPGASLLSGVKPPRGAAERNTDTYTDTDWADFTDFTDADRDSFGVTGAYNPPVLPFAASSPLGAASTESSLQPLPSEFTIVDDQEEEEEEAEEGEEGEEGDEDQADGEFVKDMKDGLFPKDLQESFESVVLSP